MTVLKNNLVRLDQNCPHEFFKILHETIFFSPYKKKLHKFILSTDKYLCVVKKYLMNLYSPKY